MSFLDLAILYGVIGLGCGVVVLRKNGWQRAGWASGALAVAICHLLGSPLLRATA